MIIIGYPGIGKSTLANKSDKYVDLESGNFWVDGKRADDWYKPYCQIAEHLSEQDYNVFVSSHKVVREQLATSKQKVICCLPHLCLKDAWIARLKARYEASELTKDYRAWKMAEETFEDSVNDMSSDVFGRVFLEDIDYNLEERLRMWIW